MINHPPLYRYGKMSFSHTVSDILDPKPSLPIVVGDGYLAAIPMMGKTTKFVVIHNGSPVKVCRNRQSAVTLIDKLRKRKDKST